MFPVDFALGVISRYSNEDDLVIDPFCGRGTSVYCAAALDRAAFGVEINAVGWVYSSTKIAPAAQDAVLKRLKDVAVRAKPIDLPDLPRFFVKAYAPNVRRFLSVARRVLDWRNDLVDRTAMSMLLLYAHGSRDNSLSNQMRQTKSMSPAYAIRWWEQHDLKPPDLDPIDFLESRLLRRYKYGKPKFRKAEVVHGDSTDVLVNRDLSKCRWSLLLTSPPYMKMANYHYDQWLRGWLLGGMPYPVVNGGNNQTWFANADKYRVMLKTVFEQLAGSAKRNAVVYVRTDARKETKRITREVLMDAFPRKSIRIYPRPLNGRSQTDLYNASDRAGEVDIILR